MNPFDLRGPEFLAFYAALGLAAWALVILRRRVMEPGGTVEGRLADPEEIAILRGGPAEAVAVSALSLLERGALESKAGLVVAAKEPPAGALLALDVEVLAACRTPRHVPALVSEPRAAAVLDRHRRSLEEKGLLPDGVQKTARWLSAIVAVGLLAGVAATKIQVALARGKHNLLFLVLLWIGLTALILWKASPRRTPRGNRALADLESLLAHVKRSPPRVQPAVGATDAVYATPDLMMLAAVYGMSSLPWSVRNSHADVIPQAAPPPSTFGSTGSSGCGSSGGCGGSSGGGGGCGGCGGGGD